MFYSIWQMSWGWMGAMGDAGGLAYLTLPRDDRELVYRELRDHAAGELADNPAWFTGLRQLLDRYFQGEYVDFREISLQWDLVTPYRRRVLAKAQEIPYGETRTYKWLAEAVGNPKGARSVGQAMAHNPWPLIVPCHRVIGTNGRLTGFGGGLSMKERLLALESKGRK